MASIMKSDNMDKRELLSALLDGQLNVEDSQQILDELLKDDELLSEWQNLNLINNACQYKMDDTLLKGDISKNISQALENEPAHFIENAVELKTARTTKVDWHNRSILFKSGVGLAVAASVMFVTINLSQLLTHPAGNPGKISSQQIAEVKKEALPVEQYSAPAYVASQLSESVRIPFAHTATFSQNDEVSRQTVSGRNNSLLDKKKHYPLSEDKFIELKKESFDNK